MTQPITCPNPATLEAFLAGRIGEGEAHQLDEHVVACAACTATIASLNGHDTLLSAMKAGGGRNNGNLPPSLVDDVVARVLNGVASSDPTAAQPDDWSQVFAPPQQPDEIGRLANFRVLRQLGQGGMGAVFAAEDTKLHRPVALKFMRPKLTASPLAAERFLREGRAAASIRHENVITIYQVCETSGVPLIAQELLEGETLQNYIDRLGKPHVKLAVRICSQIASGLSAAHARGILHRDIKPSNVWLEAPQSRAKILDFGLARFNETDGASGLTHSGMILGTPAYLSPEQASSGSVDARSDVYSLGVVFYQLLTGELPFKGHTRVLLDRILHDDPVPPRKLNRALPRDLETICLTAMAKEPARRYQTAAEMEADLRRWLNDETIQARPVSRAERLWRWCRKRPAIAGLSAVVAALLVTLILLLPMSLRRAPASISLIADRAVELSEASGQSSKTTADAIGSTNSLGLPEARGGYALQFMGEGSYVEIPAIATVYQHPLTVEARVRPGPVSLEASLFHLDGWLTMALSPNRSVAAWILHETDGLYHLRSGGVTPRATPFYVAVTFDGLNMQLFIDGKRRSGEFNRVAGPRGEHKLEKVERIEPDRLSPSRPTTPTRLGQSDGSFPLQGTIDELRISDSIRYLKDFTPVLRLEPDTNTLALYHFDEGQGEVLHDSSGNGHHGAIVNALWVREIVAGPPQNDFAFRGANSASPATETAITDCALQFGGTNCYVAIPEMTTAYQHPLTVEAWIWQEPAAPSVPWLFLDGWLSMGLNKDSAPGAWISLEGNAMYHVRASAPTPRDMSCHLAVVFDGPHLHLFIDGKRKTGPFNRFTGAGTNLKGQIVDRIQMDQLSPTWPTRSTRIGQNYASPPFHGKIDELRISTTVRYTEDFTPATRHAPDKDTLALYHFDEGQGDALIDSSGNGHHGKIVNAKWVSGIARARVETSTGVASNPMTSQPGYCALVFNGKDSYVDLPTLYYDGSHPITLEATVSPAVVRDGHHIVGDMYEGGIALKCSPGDLTGSLSQFWFTYSDANAKPSRFIDLVAQMPARTSPRIHVAGVRQGNGSRLFIDGKPVAVSMQIGEFVRAKGAFRIGAHTLLGASHLPAYKRNHATTAFSGVIDEVRISKVARYTEAFTLTARFEPDKDTLALYHFDEGQGDVLTDSSGNGHHGKIVNAKWVPLAEINP